MQVTLNVHPQAVGGLVTARAIFLQGFHHDPVEITTKEADEFRRVSPTVAGGARQIGVQHRAQTCRGAFGFFVADGLAHGVQPGSQ